MFRTQTVSRTFAMVLAIAALAAPTALARPIDSPTGSHAAASARAQDLQHLSAGGKIHTSSLAGTSEAQLGNAGPVYWDYEHPASIPAAQAVETDNGTPWLVIGIAFAGVCLLVAAAAALSGRIRPRTPGARAAA